MIELVGTEEERMLAEEAKKIGVVSASQEGQVIEGIFDGQNMVGPDGKKYSVPANYASKSKLVEGDSLKLTITPDGSFVYKQINLLERDRIVGELTIDQETSEFRVLANNKSYKVLTASITYFKGEEGDKVTILAPKGRESTWAAVENIFKYGETPPEVKEEPREEGEAKEEPKEEAKEEPKEEHKEEPKEEAKEEPKEEHKEEPKEEKEDREEFRQEKEDREEFREEYKQEHRETDEGEPSDEFLQENGSGSEELESDKEAEDGLQAVHDEVEESEPPKDIFKATEGISTDDVKQVDIDGSMEQKPLIDEEDVNLSARRDNLAGGDSQGLEEL